MIKRSQFFTQFLKVIRSVVNSVAFWSAEKAAKLLTVGAIIDTIDSGGDTINGGFYFLFGHTFLGKRFKIHEFRQILQFKSD